MRDLTKKNGALWEYYESLIAQDSSEFLLKSNQKAAKNRDECPLKSLPYSTLLICQDQGLPMQVHQYEPTVPLLFIYSDADKSTCLHFTPCLFEMLTACHGCQSFCYDETSAKHGHGNQGLHQPRKSSDICTNVSFAKLKGHQIMECHLLSPQRYKGHVDDMDRHLDLDS